MKRRGILIIFIAILLSLVPSQAFSLPTLQTYIPGATAGDYGPDQDTWWYVGAGTFNLYGVGVYNPNMISLTGVTLLISVPEGETGTISFSTSDEPPTLLTTIGKGSASETNPTANANIRILNNVAGNSGYATVNYPTFLPSGLNLNNHYPLKDDVSDFIIFDLGDFYKSESNLYDYNADSGAITQTGQSGEQKEYLVNVSEFTWVHFDAYGLETDLLGGKKLVKTWENNPGSHDTTTAVPEPSTLLLLGSGLFGVGLYRWRRMRKQK